MSSTASAGKRFLSALVSSDGEGRHLLIKSSDMQRSISEAKELIKEDEERIGDFSGKGYGFRWIFLHVFHGDAEIREKAIKLLKKVDRIPVKKDFDLWCEWRSELSQGGEIVAWMTSELSNGDGTHSLRVLNLFLRFLHTDLHSSSGGTPVINALLTVIEKAFKSTDPLRLAAFESWKALIDNFALNPSILSNAKRIKLLVRPLVANNNAKTEELVTAKFGVWWYLIDKLGDSLLKHMSSVLIPFLKFLFGIDANAITSSNSSSPFTSPLKKYVNLQTRSLDAFYRLLVYGKSESCSLPPLDSLSRPGICTKFVLLDHYRPLLSSLEECALLVKFNNRGGVEKFKSIFDTLSDLLNSVILNETGEEKVKEVTGYFVSRVHAIIYAAKRKAHTQKMVFHMLEKTVSMLPPSYLGYKYTVTTPMDVLLDIIFHSDILQLAKEGKQSYFEILNLLLDKGRQKYTFFFLQKLAKKACDGSQDKKPKDLTEIWQCVWKSIVSFSYDYVENSKEINESDNRVGHNFDTIFSILSFPIHYLMGVTSKEFWKAWNDMYSVCLQSAEMVLTYKSLEFERYFATLSLDKLKLPLENSASSPQVFQFNNFCRLTVFLSENISFKDECEYSSLEPLLDLIRELVSQASKNFNKIGGASVGVGRLCASLSNILAKLPSALIGQVLKVTGSAIVTLLGMNFLTTFGSGYENQAENLVERAVGLLQVKYVGKFDIGCLENAKSLLLCLLTHGKKSLKSKGHRLWQLTFAENLKPEEIPSDIASVLRKSLVLSSESSQSSIDSFPVQSTIIETLVKSTASPDVKAITPSKTARSPSRSPFSALKTKAKTRNVNDDDSQDFVPIHTPPVKKRVLTEHQKEIMTSRKDDIPALYSELSRDDSSLIDIPSQFVVPLVSDEAAMDGVSVKNKDASVSQSLLAGEESIDKVSDKPDSSNKREISIGSENVSTGNNSSANCSKILQDCSLLVADSSSSANEESKKSTARELNFNKDSEDDDIVQSSQTNPKPSTPITRKRKRESSVALLSVDKKRVKVENKVDRINPGKENEKQRTKRANMFGESPLHIAVKKGDVKKVASLLKSGADINPRCHAGWMPIHESIQEGEHYMAIIKLLLQHGADINACGGDNDNTPLHEAVLYLSTEGVRFLIEKGANPYAENKEKKRPVDLAPDDMLAILDCKPSEKRKSDSVEDGSCPASPIKTRQKRKTDSKKKVTIILESQEESAEETPMSIDVEDEVVQDVRRSNEPSMNQTNEKDGKIVEDMSKSSGENSKDDEDSSQIIEDQIPNSDSKSEGHKDAVKDNVEVFQENEEKIISLPKPDIETSENTIVCSSPKKISLNPSKVKESPPVFSVHQSRGAKLLEMSKAANNRKSDTIVSLKCPPSPSVLNLTPKQNKMPWQKFAPSPSNASPSASILKRRNSDYSPSDRQRKVQFSDPPVSERVEIPRKKSQNEREEEEFANFTGVTSESSSIDGSVVYSPLNNCPELISSIISSLTNRTWQKTVEKDLKDKNIFTVGDISQLDVSEVNQLKGLKPPSLSTLRDVLKCFEKTYKWPCKSSEEESSKSKVVQALAPFVEVQTPEEEEKNIREIYECPSPSPTDENESCFKSVQVSAEMNIAASQTQTMETRHTLIQTEETKAVDISCQTSTKETVTQESQCLVPVFSEATVQTEPISDDKQVEEFLSLSKSLDRSTIWNVVNHLLAALRKNE